MNIDLRELYQEIIIDHNKNPRNHHVMEDASTSANGFNPLCGDKLTLYLKIKGNLIQAASFVGCGCAISQASASLMTEAVKDKTIQEADDLFDCFHEVLTEEHSTHALPAKLSVLVGVKAYPARVKCATLPWHTFHAALHKACNTVSTE